MINQKVLLRLLQSKGFVSLTVAANGLEAVGIVSQLQDIDQFSAILMDCEMPVCDGFEATQRIRQLGCKTPIIVLTASATKENRERCATAGMDLYHTKPVNIDSLVTMFIQIQSETSISV